MRDNHLHSRFSYDCETELTQYLDVYTGEIITTEHFDLSNPYGGRYSDDIPDYEAYTREIKELSEKYGNRLKIGIEIGYYSPRKDDILAYLKNKTYDLKLLSVHHNGIFDYLEEQVFELDKKTHIHSYMLELMAAIDAIPADVLAHFDYGFRKLSVTVEELKAHEETLCELFKKMIAHGMAFELNAKSMYLYGHKDLYCYALSLIKRLGGSKISVGSDGHCLEHFKLHFAEIKTILDQYDISEDMII